MEIRPYEPRDRASCLAVFDSLTPALVSSAALPLFESWLAGPDGPYFVMEHEEAVVGCGGYSLSSDRSSAALRWGMVRHGSQRMGLGRFLLMYRIREIGREGTVGVVFARVPRPSAGFFERQGFRANGIDVGLDVIELVRKLTVCP